MGKKRRNSGRTGSSKGRSKLVQCTKCHASVPRGKAKRVTRRVSFIDPQIAKELRDAGTVMNTNYRQDWLCISCAIHNHKIKIRSKDSRKERDRI